MNRKLLIQPTADGSPTIYLPELDEHYHSVNGAVQESMHVFIDAGLRQCRQKKISILEIGFGTGLNAFLSMLESSKTDLAINYTAFELYPLDTTFVEQLNYASDEREKELFFNLHLAAWNEKVEITGKFSLRKIHADFNTHDALQADALFDVIYFDAFAPNKQPEMWNESTFSYLYAHTRSGGIIVTYCAKGAVRRMLHQAGYKTERLAGPPGKREMLRGRK